MPSNNSAKRNKIASVKFTLCMRNHLLQLQHMNNTTIIYLDISAVILIKKLTVCFVNLKDTLIVKATHDDLVQIYERLLDQFT